MMMRIRPMSPQEYYAEEIIKLEENLEINSFNYKNKRQLFVDFSQKFTTLPEIWNKWIEFERLSNGHLIEGLKQEALTHLFSYKFIKTSVQEVNSSHDFYKTIECPYLDVIRFKCNNVNHEIVKEGLLLAEEALSFPHRKLEEVLEIYKKASRNYISTEIAQSYRNSKNLYWSLAKSENDDKKWFTFLMLCHSYEIVIQNVEARIGDNPWNLNLWKIYINYLKEIDSIKRLNVLKRCARLFFKDREIYEEYQNEIQKVGLSKKCCVASWWIDAIKLGIDFNSIDDARKVLEKALKCSGTESEILKFSLFFEKKYGNSNSKTLKIMKKSLTYLSKKPGSGGASSKLPEKEVKVPSAAAVSDLYTFKHPRGQQFSVANNVLYYALRKGNVKLFHNLLGTCKSFFAKFKVIPCFELRIDGTRITAYSTPSKEETPRNGIILQQNEIRNYYIIDALTVEVKNNRDFLINQLLGSIYRCDAKEIELVSQNIPLHILNFLIGGSVTSINLMNCRIYKENGQEMNVQEVVGLFPNALKIEIGPLLPFTPTTAQDLLNLNFTHKIEKFCLAGVVSTFDPSIFFDFAVKNASNEKESSFILTMSLSTSRTVERQFYNLLESKLDATKFAGERPIITTSSWM